MRMYMHRRYQIRRAAAIKHLGSKCIDCGSMLRLEFDHVERRLKAGEISDLMTYSTAVFWMELEKCVLRCHECHSAKTSRETTVGHGGGLTGKKSCYCEKCAPLKREYMRQRRAAAKDMPR